MPDLLLYDHAASICSQMARLALVEKECHFRRHAIDIMETSEQFDAWYVALNPRAVVPTLRIDDEIVTDTIHIVNRVQALPGPDLSGDATTQDWLRDIMALHYGVLLYRRRLDPDGTTPQIFARGRLPERLRVDRPGLDDLIDTRLAGNRRFQALLKDPVGIEQHVAGTHALIDRMASALDKGPYLSGQTYSLADCFATAALARFVIHGLAEAWKDSALTDYYARMKSRASFVTAGVIDTGHERDL
ncbi:MAG: glutathione S-transferase family protein [Hyphomicrobiales bacterium]|nr:glutathione S-transferase family protein [Hyphomicrobiales bacterium]MCP5000343.1 glutathione S-transferase family protein [Hyphomicrobiales bacterium]